MRIGVFGGSFDPIHLGHVAAARAAADRLDLDRVLFIPARQQPLKRGGHAASPDDRAAMVRAAVAADARFALDDRELRRAGPSYTVDTLRSLRAEYPRDTLFLLVGADAARELPRWREADVIPQLAEVVVLTRPGIDAPVGDAVARRLDIPAHDIAAQDIRARCRRGEPLAGLVPDAVARYIAAHRLYTNGD